MRRLSRSDSGTSPATMRCASPSTTAVFPTPGSPMSTGLFFVRRESTCTTRRISESRPITGSSLPSRASRVMSRPYFSSALYVPSGSGLVTLPEPRTAGRAAASWSRDAPSVRRMSPAGDDDAASAIRRCSVDTYSSPSAPASSPAVEITVIIARDACGWATEAPEAPGSAATDAFARDSTVCGSAPTACSSPAATPPSWATSAASRCTGSSVGLPAWVADWSAAAIASCDLVVSLSVMGPPVDGHRCQPCQS